MLRRRAGVALPPADPIEGPRIVRGLCAQGYLLEKVHEAMAASRYGLRERSDWVEEAFAGLLVHDPAVLKSAAGDIRLGSAPEDVDAKMQKIRVLIRPRLDAQVQRLKLQVVRQNPELTGAYSFLMRCAMRHRLRNPGLYPMTSQTTPESLFEAALALTIGDET